MGDNKAKDEDYVFIGDFKFKLKGNLIRNYLNQKDVANGDYSAYDEEINRLMNAHYMYYSSMEEWEELDYVKKGSILCCSEGTKMTKFDVLSDHGVVENDESPIGICSDNTDRNIYSFGTCKKSAPEGLPERPLVNTKNGPMYQCFPVQASEWSGRSSKLSIWDDEKGEYREAITSGYFVPCSYGGVITVIEVPEKDKGITSIDQAYSVMTDYINGKIVTDVLLNKAIDYAANHGNQTHVKSFSTLNDSSHNYDRYDNMILGWTNYWNDNLDISYHSGIDANLVKAVMYTETKIGYYKGSVSSNGSIDVMQVLDNRNPPVQRLAACGHYDPNEGFLYGLPINGYGGLQVLFPNKIYNKSAATVNMSIAFGTRWLVFKIDLKGEMNGIIDYNGGGDSNYYSKVNGNLNILT